MVSSKVILREKILKYLNDLVDYTDGSQYKIKCKYAIYQNNKFCLELF